MFLQNLFEYENQEETFETAVDTMGRISFWYDVNENKFHLFSFFNIHIEEAYDLLGVDPEEVTLTYSDIMEKGFVRGFIENTGTSRTLNINGLNFKELLKTARHWCMKYPNTFDHLLVSQHGGENSFFKMDASDVPMYLKNGVPPRKRF